MRSGRPLRVAVLAPHFAEYATRLAIALTRHAEVLLVTESRNGRAECEGLGLAEPAGLTRATYRGDIALRTLSVQALVERGAIHRAIDAFAPDLIHVQEQGDPFTASLVARYARSLPIVLTVHDPVPHSGADSATARRWARGLVANRAAAHAYHVHGAHCASALRRVLGPAKPIIETAHGTILEPHDAQIEPAGPRYLFFGRMEAYKGVDTLIDAIDLLAGEDDLSFVVAGRGPELERCRARMSGNSAIEIIDKFLPPAEAIRQFQRARAVLVPYKDATQSGVVSAAFGNGRPVVASRTGGLVDAVEDGVNGLLVPPGDPAALAAAVRAMEEPATCDRLTRGARAAAQGAFAWDGIAGRLHELYAGLCGSVKARPQPR